MGLTSALRKKGIVEKNQRKPRISLEKRQIRQCKTDMLIGSWNVRTLYRNSSIIMFTQQLMQYNLDITAIQETRWQDKHIMDTKTHTLSFLVGKKGENMNMK
jgi:hypothetical protein